MNIETYKTRIATAVASLWPALLTAQEVAQREADQVEDSTLSFWSFVIVVIIIFWVWNKDRKRLRQQDEDRRRTEAARQAAATRRQAEDARNVYAGDAEVAEILRDAELQRVQQEERGHHYCPHCGAQLDEFTSHCPYCGHELREMLAEKGVRQLFNEYNAAYTYEAKTTIVNGFTLPTDREGVMEFLALSAPLAKLKNPLSSTRWGRVLLTFVAVFVVLTIGNAIIFSISGKDLGDAASDALLMLPALGGFPAFFVARRTDTGVAVEHNRFAPLWRRRFNECLQTARQKFTSAADAAIFDSVEKEARENPLASLLTGNSTFNT